MQSGEQNDFSGFAISFFQFGKQFFQFVVDVALLQNGSFEKESLRKTAENKMKVKEHKGFVPNCERCLNC